ncbi:MAG: hypothetical protein ACFN09_02230 [Bifidobacterium dentium]
MKINEAVGEYIRKFRKEGQYTLDDLASRSHEFGSNWTSATIANMEKGGSRADALPNILVLLATMNSLDDEKWAIMRKKYSLSDEECKHDRRKLADIFDDVKGIVISRRYSVPSSCVVTALQGGEVDLVDVNRVIPTVILKKRIDALEELGKLTGRLLRASVEEAEKRGLKMELGPAIYATSAEIRAAKKLDVDPLEFANYCLLRYGHSMDEEAAKRAGDDASPQKRGRATREIMEEFRLMDDSIRKAMNDAETFSKKLREAKTGKDLQDIFGLTDKDFQKAFGPTEMDE